MGFYAELKKQLESYTFFAKIKYTLEMTAHIFRTTFQLNRSVKKGHMPGTEGKTPPMWPAGTFFFIIIIYFPFFAVRIIFRNISFQDLDKTLGRIKNE